VKRKLLAGMLGLFLIFRLLPGVSIFWAGHVSGSLLAALAAASTSFPFALLEWMSGAGCVLLLGCVFLRKLRRVLCGMLLIMLMLSLSAWYPLYFRPQPAYAAKDVEIAVLCERLIDQLNASSGELLPPEDLPAKFIRFPQWMDALEISGLCSFLTGEALISPDLPPISQPFVAVHEWMHLRGYAGEGAANIAAWEECMLRGGAYAFSARIWALRYAMGFLRQNAPALYDSNLPHMNHGTLQFYREAGGAYTAAAQPVFLQRLYTFLGIENVMQDYEILAPYLAAKYAG